jgi:hypothetical protein
MKPERQDKVGDITFGRYIFDKVFKGDLEATSKVEMLAAGSDNGSGAYVAMEHVNGKLNGKNGTFVLTHMGTRTSYSQELTVLVVPGCSTGDLAGLEGKLSIDIIDKVHFYTLEYFFSD